MTCLKVHHACHHMLHSRLQAAVGFFAHLNMLTACNAVMSTSLHCALRSELGCILFHRSCLTVQCMGCSCMAECNARQAYSCCCLTVVVAGRVSYLPMDMLDTDMPAHPKKVHTPPSSHHSSPSEEKTDSAAQAAPTPHIGSHIQRYASRQTQFTIIAIKLLPQLKSLSPSSFNTVMTLR